MLTSNEEIIHTIIISTLMLLFFAVFVVVAILKYRNKSKEFVERENTVKIELVKATLEAKEQTLEDLSEKIHIDIQQSLSLAKLNLNKVLLHPDKIEVAKIIKIKELIVNTIEEVKSLSKDLDPKYITGHTLEENILRQLKRVEEKAELQTIFKTSEEEISINKEKQTFIYRIVQEAINNILAHAGATLIKIELKNNTNEFVITIEDNGKGFNETSLKNKENKISTGIGLINMKNRTKLINGTFLIKSKPNSGTKITLKIPYND